MATSVSLRSFLFVQMTPSPDGSSPRVTLNFPDIRLDYSWPISDLPLLQNVLPIAPSSLSSDILKTLEPCLEPFAKKEVQNAAVMAFLYLFVSLYRPGTSDIRFVLRSSIPIGAGLGSSASISVCLSTALLIISNHILFPSGPNPDVLKIINDWAFLGEKCIHGNPSGVDNTVATFGGGVFFRKERRERKLSNGTFTPSQPAEKEIIRYVPLAFLSKHRIPPVHFLLTDTNHPRRTANLVARVAELMTTLPGVTTHILSAIDGIAAEAKRLLESDENITERLGELISINQGLLNSVGVGHEKLDTVARITKDIGWTKLTGAGGGGSALTLLHEGISLYLCV